MAVLPVALLDAAVLWLLWPQPDRLFLLGAWTLAVGNCVVAPYLAAGRAAWRWRRALADPKATTYEKQLARFARDAQLEGLLGPAWWQVALYPAAARAGASALAAYPQAREGIRLATAGLGVVVGMWATWSAARR